MKLRTIALVLAVALASAAAYAQSGVYVTMEAQQFTQEGVLLNPATNFGGNHGNIDRPWLYGPGYGAYYVIHRIPWLDTVPGIKKFSSGPVSLGIDGRGNILRLSDYHSSFNREDGLASLRIAPKTMMIMGSTPYVMAGIGVGHTKVPGRTAYSNNLLYQFTIGADHKIHNHIEWRVLEASAGFLAKYNTAYSQNGIGPNQSNYEVTLGTGIVFQIR